jgi:hypothetical protein
LSGEPKRGKPQFKDYCLILQVHPEADAAMIDAAYWHLAKRWNEAAPHDSHASWRMEELNEAYSVLGSPDRREEYMKVRAKVLGTNALPVPPPPAPEKPPLAFMARQRPRPREPEAAAEQVRKLWAPSAISSALAIPFVLALAVAAFLAGASPAIVAGLLAVGLLFTAAPLASAIPKLHLALPSIRARMPVGKPSANLPRRRARAMVTPIDTARVHSSTKSRAEQLRRHEATPSPPADKARD